MSEAMNDGDETGYRRRRSVSVVTRRRIRFWLATIIVGSGIGVFVYHHETNPVHPNFSDCNYKPTPEDCYTGP